MATGTALKTAGEWTCRLLLGGIFAYAATTKLFDPAAFASDIGHYHLLPYPPTLAMAVYLPWVELLCAAAVLTRRLERGALLLLFVLCTVFSAALISAWVRGLDISCGCFGSAASTTVPLALTRSLALGLVAFYLLKRSTWTQACLG